MHTLYWIIDVIFGSVTSASSREYDIKKNIKNKASTGAHKK